MLFNSLTFLVFFAVVMTVHRLPLSWKIRKGNLLLASYLFYGAWDWRFLSLIFISTAVDYYVAPRAAPGRSQSSRRIALAISVAVNLGILGFFKYFDFFVDSFVDLFDMPYPPNDVFLNIVLPRDRGMVDQGSFE